MSAGKVHYSGEQAIIHEPTGVLLQPGVNEIAEQEHYDAIIAAGVAAPAAEAPSKPE